MSAVRIFLLSLLFPFFSYSQIEKQVICEGLKKGNYFPLDIKAKKIVWYDTYYYERLVGTKILNGKTYFEFEQEWKNGNKDYLFLREEDKTIFEYEECCQEETVRFSDRLKKETPWVSVSGKFEYKLVATNETLITPFCNYKDLLVLEAKYEGNVFRFYYQKGLGYVGAEKDGELISFLLPEI